MAGRIRSFKPELLDLEPAAALSSDAWRIWVSMMLLADDLGNLRASPKLIAAHVFHDTQRVVTIEHALEELTRMPDICRVVLYRYGGEIFAHLNGFVDGQCQAIAQFPSKLNKEKAGRVPAPDSPGVEPLSTVPKTYESSRNRTEPKRTKKNQPVPISSGENREEPRAHAHSPFPYPYPDHKHKDLPPNVVAALPSLARVSKSDDGHGSKHVQANQPEPPTARSVPAPERSSPAVEQNLAVVTSAEPHTTLRTPPPQIPTVKTNVVPQAQTDHAPVHRPKFEPQRQDGRDILDPKTGGLLVLDLNLLTPEQVVTERERCLAAMAQAKPAPPIPKPAAQRMVPAPAVQAPQPTVATPEDPEAAMFDMLAAAPKPICLLAQRSASRLAHVLIGTSVRAADILPALQAAAMKLDPKFLGLTAESPGYELEELHRFVAGFVAKAHLHRAKPSAPSAATAPTEAGIRFVASYCEAYRKRFGKDYSAAEDDPQHGTTIVTALGQRLRRESESEADVQKMRKRMGPRLLEQWFDDQFAARCGYSLRQLARLLSTEPNRFSFGATPTAYGASSMRPDIGLSLTASLSPENQAKHDEIIARVGSHPAAKEHHAETNDQKAMG